MPKQVWSSEPGGMAAENRRQVGRFLIVGGASVAVDFAGYLLVTGLLGGGTHLAKGISYLAGTVVGFFGNKFWTFGSARRSLAEPIAYGVLYAITLAVNIGVNGATLTACGPRFTLLAFLAATGTTMVLNFLGLRLVAFRVGIRQRRDAESVSPTHMSPSPLRGAAKRSSTIHELTRG